MLNPRQSSLYGKLRREPRREGLSTIEAAALTLSRIEQRPEIETAMRASFAHMLARYRSARSQGGMGDLGAYSTEKTGTSKSDAEKRLRLVRECGTVDQRFSVQPCTSAASISLQL